MASPHGWKTSARGAAALFALGLLGVIALATYSVPALREIPELSALSYPTLVLLASVNSLLLLVVFVSLGAATAPRIGLTSHVFTWAAGGTPEWGEIRGSLPLALALGTGLFVLIAILDVVFAQFTGVTVGEPPGDADALADLLASIPMRLLYGGITEELLLRWGFMAPVAYGLWWVWNRIGEPSDVPSEPILWVAIVVSAVMFGVGHLPALAAAFELTTPLVIRTVVLNALAGLVFGWLFWRRSLETAMIAHAAFHVALVVTSVVLLVLF